MQPLNYLTFAWTLYALNMQPLNYLTFAWTLYSLNMQPLNYLTFAWTLYALNMQSLKGGGLPETNEIVTHICSCHNFSPLSSVQIIIIPACCLLCVL